MNLFRVVKVGLKLNGYHTQMWKLKAEPSTVSVKSKVHSVNANVSLFFYQ